MLKTAIAFKLSNAVFIMVENVKMPIFVGILTFYKHDRFHAHVS